jgi:hypothetical protein
MLPTIDWRKVFESGKEYAEWIAIAENKDHAAAMEEMRKSQHLEPCVVAALRALPRPVHAIAIAEDWCGDVVRHVPVLRRMAEEAANVRVRFITREQYPEVFARFLTNGGEAIPKFVFLNDRFVECGNWGPMPLDCRELISRGKACGDVAAARAKVSALYAADADRQMVVGELMRLIEIASATTP